MELLTWVDTLLAELPALWNCVKTGVYPSSFLTNAMGLSAETTQKLPDYLAMFVGFWLVCGVVTLVLHFARGQKSLHNWAEQVGNVILTVSCTIFVPLLLLMGKLIAYNTKLTVAPPEGGADYIRFVIDLLGQNMDLLIAFVALLFPIWMPIFSAARYPRTHGLRGLPHMVFDLGTGPYLVCVALLWLAKGEKLILLLIPLAVVMLALGQTGGYISGARNTRAAQEAAQAAKEAAKAAKSDEKNNL